MRFESHFRDFADKAIEPWLEVIYWKLFSQPARRDRKTREIATHFEKAKVSPNSLYQACISHIHSPTQGNLDSIRKLLGFKAKVIAIAATFPAFLRPDILPMVDTRIAKWVVHSMIKHNRANPSGPQLISPRFVQTKQTVLMLNDFPFIERWIEWCSHTARKLTALSFIQWRPRDVEMAVLTLGGIEKTDIQKSALSLYNQCQN